MTWLNPAASVGWAVQACLALVPVALPKVRAENPGLERPSRRGNQKLLGREQAAFLVYVGAQPGAQRTEVTLRKCREDVRLGAAGCLEELRRHHGSQRIRREVAPGSRGPMDILQAA